MRPFLILAVLFAIASPLAAQPRSLSQELDDLRAETKAFKDAMEARQARVEADLGTIKMNQNVHGANIDALNAKVDKLLRQQSPQQVQVWSESAIAAPVLAYGVNVRGSPMVLPRVLPRLRAGG